LALNHSLCFSLNPLKRTRKERVPSCENINAPEQGHEG
jgi:hypothetical protein